MSKASALCTVLPATLLAVACSTAPTRSATQTVSDDALAQSVYAALNADPVYFYRHVDVAIDDGVASLSGYVWCTEAIYRARQIAGGIPGIRRVATNNLELERQGSNNGRTR